MMSKLNTILGEYGFKNHFSVNVAYNVDPEEIFYTEVHEYMHSRLTMGSPYGLYVYLLTSCGRHDIKFEKLRTDLIENMRFVQEAYATFSEQCHVYLEEGKDSFLKKLLFLKENNYEYYKYYESLAFTLEHCEVEEAMLVAEIISFMSMNTRVYNIPKENKARKKFFSQKENAQKFHPNSRFKALCKMIKSVLEEEEKEKESQEKLSEWIEQNCEMDFNTDYIDLLKEDILDIYSDSNESKEIENTLSKMVSFEVPKYYTFLTYPTTTLGKKSDVASSNKIDNWNELFEKNVKRNISFVPLSSLFINNIFGVLTFNIKDNNSKIVANSKVSYINIEEIGMFLNYKPNTIVMIGNKNLCYDFYEKNNIKNSYQFIDEALIDSMSYINNKFEGSKYRVFNYRNTFSILLISNGSLKVLQPLSIHSLDQIKLACENGILKLQETIIKDDDFDDFLIKNSKEKKELDLIVSLIYFNL